MVEFISNYFLIFGVCLQFLFIAPDISAYRLPKRTGLVLVFLTFTGSMHFSSIFQCIFDFVTVLFIVVPIIIVTGLSETTMKSISFSNEVFYFVRNVRARSTTNFHGLYWGVHIQDKMCRLRFLT